VQLESEVPPGKSSAVPAGQGAQREAPGEGAYEPGAQLPQSPMDAAPLNGFSVPAGQGRQEAALMEPGAGL
jgi:hypothetical protein